MIILGIAFSHNGSVSLIKDGKIIVAIQAERLTRVKRQSIDMDKNLFALEKCLNYCLTSAGLTINDIDCAAIKSDHRRLRHFRGRSILRCCKEQISVTAFLTFSPADLNHAEFIAIKI